MAAGTFVCTGSVDLFAHFSTYFIQGIHFMRFKTLLRPLALTGAVFAALAGCSGAPVSIENPPLGADGQSRWLFVYVNETTDGAIGGLYARKAGAGSWGDDLQLIGIVGPGEGKAYNLDDGSGNCKFDLRRRIISVNQPPVFQDQLNIDLCEMNRKKQAWLL
jgi:hypothetical protein